MEKVDPFSKGSFGNGWPMDVCLCSNGLLVIQPTNNDGYATLSLEEIVRFSDWLRSSLENLKRAADSASGSHER